MFPEPFKHAFLAARTCSKAVFELGVGHGKSPWFSRVRRREANGVDAAGLALAFVDVGVFMECAF
jgi:hypothetical protein